MRYSNQWNWKESWTTLIKYNGKQGTRRYHRCLIKEKKQQQAICVAVGWYSCMIRARCLARGMECTFIKLYSTLKSVIWTLCARSRSSYLWLGFHCQVWACDVSPQRRMLNYAPSPLWQQTPQFWLMARRYFCAWTSAFERGVDGEVMWGGCSKVGGSALAVAIGVPVGGNVP